MKTYILDTYNKYKRLSKKLDAATTLCNRSWVVFNDSGEREVYKFKEDGTMRIVLSGRISDGRWEYDPNDDTIALYASDQAVMVHPAMYDGKVLAMNMDGTQEVAFLIDSKNAGDFEPKTLSELMEFFQSAEIRLLAAIEKEAENLREKERIDKRKSVIEEFKKFLIENEYGPRPAFMVSKRFFIFTALNMWVFLLSLIIIVIGVIFDLNGCNFVVPFLCLTVSFILLPLLVFLIPENDKKYYELEERFRMKYDDAKIFNDDMLKEMYHTAKFWCSIKISFKAILYLLQFNYDKVKEMVEK